MNLPDLKKMEYHELHQLITDAATQIIALGEKKLAKQIIPQVVSEELAFAHGVLALHYQLNQVTAAARFA